MKKKIIPFILAVPVVLLLTACGCKHTWQDATCDIPKTCTSCGETEGTPLDHHWNRAGCIPACSLCGLEDAASASHQWAEATCDSPKTCTACSATEGAALDHTWTDADCFNPRQCAACGMTDGEPLEHTLPAGSDGVFGICPGCGKAVEFFGSSALTVYDVAPDGSYENPVTTLYGTGRTTTVQWVKDGVIQGWNSTDLSNTSIGVSAYYVDGRVYYYDGGANGEATARKLANAARKYVSAPYYNYAAGHSITMTSSDFMDVKGEAAAAVDAYGTQYVIVNKFGGWGAAYDPATTYLVKTNWKN